MHREQRHTQPLARRRQARYPLRPTQHAARVRTALRRLNHSLDRGSLPWLSTVVVALVVSALLLTGSALPGDRGRMQAAAAPSTVTGRALLQAQRRDTLHWMDTGSGTTLTLTYTPTESQMSLCDARHPPYFTF